jgi:predicted aconitase
MKFSLSGRVFIAVCFFMPVQLLAGPMVTTKAETVFLSEARNPQELVEFDHKSKSKAMRARACDIQLVAQVAPTLCYSSGIQNDQSEIDSLCVAYSAKALRLPRIDQFTSEVCKEAIARRAKDLAYFAERK